MRGTCTGGGRGNVVDGRHDDGIEADRSGPHVRHSLHFSLALSLSQNIIVDLSSSATQISNSASRSGADSSPEKQIKLSLFNRSSSLALVVLFCRRESTNDHLLWEMFEMQWMAGSLQCQQTSLTCRLGH